MRAGKPSPLEEARGLDEMARLAVGTALRKGHSPVEIKAAVERWLQAAPAERVAVVDPRVEPIELVARLMDWHNIHHIPVEDEQHVLVGLMSHRSLLRHMASREFTKADVPTPVGDVMQRDLITVGPSTPTLEAIELMKAKRI